MFNPKIGITIGFDSAEIKHKSDFNFVLWDTPPLGTNYDSIIQGYLLHSDGVILMFDISNEEDFKELPYCLELITDFYELEEFPVLLVANKIDLVRKISKEEIQKFLDKNKFIGYFEVSSKTLQNVDESINFMANYIYNKENSFPKGENLHDDNNSKVGTDFSLLDYMKSYLY